MEYVAQHPGSTTGEISKVLGKPINNISGLVSGLIKRDLLIQKDGVLYLDIPGPKSKPATPPAASPKIPQKPAEKTAEKGRFRVARTSDHTILLFGILPDPIELDEEQTNILVQFIAPSHIVGLP